MPLKKTTHLTSLQSKALTVVLIAFATKIVFELVLGAIVVVTTLLRLI